MDRQEIFAAALELEKDGKSFYEEVASKAPNEYAQKTFLSFASDEQNHIDWIRRFTDGENVELDSGPEMAKKVYDSLRGIFADIPEDRKGKLAAAENDTEQINIAIGKEEESIRAYSEWAESAEDDAVKDLFAKLVEVEKTHRTLLVNARTYLDRTGDWFMEQEQWSFDGA